MSVKEGLKYTKSHEWVKVEGSQAYVGITDHAQESLGEIVYIELPNIGQSIKRGDTFGAIESVKAASDLYLPIGGKIVEVNSALEDDPEAINRACYDSWIVKIDILDLEELNNLLTAEAYQEELDE
jgi:glycine cleavage system H protein